MRPPTHVKALSFCDGRTLATRSHTKFFLSTFLIVLALNFFGPVFSLPRQHPAQSTLLGNSIYQHHSSGLCPSADWQYSGGRCFQALSFETFIGKQKGGWLEASNYCLGIGGSLASVHTPSDESVIQDLIKVKQGACWFGLRKMSRAPKGESGWVWLDRTKVLSDGDYMNWGDDLKLIWKLLPPAEKCASISSNGWGEKPCWGGGSRLECFVCATPSMDDKPFTRIPRIITSTPNVSLNPVMFHGEEQSNFKDWNNLQQDNALHESVSSNLLPSYQFKNDHINSKRSPEYNPEVDPHSSTTMGQWAQTGGDDDWGQQNTSPPALPSMVRVDGGIVTFDRSEDNGTPLLRGVQTNLSGVLWPTLTGNGGTDKESIDEPIDNVNVNWREVKETEEPINFQEEANLFATYEPPMEEVQSVIDEMTVDWSESTMTEIGEAALIRDSKERLDIVNAGFSTNDASRSEEGDLSSEKDRIMGEESLNGAQIGEEQQVEGFGVLNKPSVDGSDENLIRMELGSEDSENGTLPTLKSINEESFTKEFYIKLGVGVAVCVLSLILLFVCLRRCSQSRLRKDNDKLLFNDFRSSQNLKLCMSPVIAELQLNPREIQSQRRWGDMCGTQTTSHGSSRNIELNSPTKFQSILGSPEQPPNQFEYTNKSLSNDGTQLIVPPTEQTLQHHEILNPGPASLHRPRSAPAVPQVHKIPFHRTLQKRDQYPPSPTTLSKKKNQSPQSGKGQSRPRTASQLHEKRKTEQTFNLDCCDDTRTIPHINLSSSPTLSSVSSLGYQHHPLNSPVLELSQIPSMQSVCDHGRCRNDADIYLSSQIKVISDGNPRSPESNNSSPLIKAICQPTLTSLKMPQTVEPSLGCYRPTIASPSLLEHHTGQVIHSAVDFRSYEEPQEEVCDGYGPHVVKSPARHMLSHGGKKPHRSPLYRGKLSRSTFGEDRRQKLGLKHMNYNLRSVTDLP